MIPKSTYYGLVVKDSGLVVFKGSQRDCKKQGRDGTAVVITSKNVGEYFKGGQK